MTYTQYLNKAKELMGFDNKDKILYLSFFGSKLYGTDTEKSDTDLKGIFLPSKDSCFMLNAVKQYTSESKEGQNTKDDIDITLYSLQYFLELLSTGDTGAMDLFFSIYSNKTIIHQEPEFIELLKINKPYLITKNPAAFFGYIMGQVSSYGIRGSRYGDLLKLRKSIEEFRNIQWEMPTHIEEYVN
jgi:predicted nucleotidyltransferase